MPKQTNMDPYTPPPMHRDRSGAVLRVALLAVMLGAAGLGYSWFAGQDRAPSASVAAEQQVAEATTTAMPPADPNNISDQDRSSTPAPALEPDSETTPSPEAPAAPIDPSTAG
ncbi:MAG: hypothetical protein R3C31_11910 [Hyphomonadaceae bacterium]